MDTNLVEIIETNKSLNELGAADILKLFKTSVTPINEKLEKMETKAEKKYQTYDSIHCNGETLHTNNS